MMSELMSACARLAAVLGVVGATGVAAVAIQTHPPESHRHAEGQALRSPEAATSDSVAIGRQRYVFMCRECHGNRGLGDGDMAHAGGNVPDFTDADWLHGSSDGEIFLVIRDGVTADMQSYENRISDEDIWHLVNYLKTLAR